MKKLAYLVLLTVIASGCVAFVNEGSEGRKVKSFIISNQETLDMLDQISQKDPDIEIEIKPLDEFKWPEKLKWPKKQNQL